MKNNNRRLRVRVRIWIRFLLFYSEVSANEPWCNKLQTSLNEKNIRRQCQMNTLFTTFEWCYTLWMALLYSEFQIFSFPSPAITTAPQINWNFVNVHLFELAVKSVLSYEIQENNSRGISHRKSWRTLFWERGL